MAKYYSQKSDFTGSAQNTGYSMNSYSSYGYNSTLTSTPGQKVTSMLEDIEQTAEWMKTYEVQQFYRATGDACFGAEKEAAAFTEAVTRSKTMMSAAKRIHREIMQNIDSSFVDGLDDAYQSTDMVNGEDHQYTTQNMKKEVTITVSGDYSNGWVDRQQTIQKSYTLEDFLGEDSPVIVAKELYQERLELIKNQIEKGDGIAEEDLEKVKKMSDEELMQAYFPTVLSEYQELKANSFYEDNKNWLGWLEIGLSFLAAGVMVFATGGLAVAALVYVAGSSIYAAATGNTLITGNELTTEERIWAAAEGGATILTAGSNKLLSMGKEVNSASRIANLVGNSKKTQTVLKALSYSDDVMDGANLVKDIANGDQEAILLDLGLMGLGGLGQLKKGMNTDQRINIDPDRVDIDAADIDALDLSNRSRTRAEQLNQNVTAYENYASNKLQDFKNWALGVEENITIRINETGERIRVKAIGVDADGSIHIQEYTTAQNGLSMSRKQMLDDLTHYGGTVVGNGKGSFSGGTEIKSGVEIDVFSLKTKNISVEAGANTNIQSNNSLDEIIRKVETGEVELVTTIQKGNYGEMKMDQFYIQRGYERISLDQVTGLDNPTHRGIDGVYYKPDGHPPYIIAEAKYGSSQLGTTQDSKQMSERWINNRLEAAVGKVASKKMKLAALSDPNSIQSQLIHVSSNGAINQSILDKSVNII